MPSPSSACAARSASSTVIPHATTATSPASAPRTTRLPPIRTRSPAGVRTGVLPRSVRRNEIPSVSAIAADQRGRLVGVAGMQDGRPVDGAERRDVLERHLRRPVLADRDARVRAARGGCSAREIAAIRMKSYARVKKAAKVEANGTQSRTWKPTAAATSCCSAMNISK